MKTKLFLVAAALWMVSCGNSSSQGWRTDDLRYIPFQDVGETMTYYDLKDNMQPGWNYDADASLFYDGFAVVENEDGGVGFINKDGALLNNETYTDVTIFHEGIAWVARPGKPIAAINKKGKILFELKQAEAVCAFHEGLAAFINANELWGLVNKQGTVVVEPCWSNVVPMVVNGMIAAKDYDLGWGLATKSGDWIVQEFDKIGGEWDNDGDIRHNYEQALAEGRIPVQDDNDKWGIIDRDGQYIINPQFDKITLDGDNYLFCKGRRYGWCDKDGHYLINPQFTDAKPFEGAKLAAVENTDGDWGFIDKKGQWVIAAQFRKAEAFLPCGVAPVCDDDSREWGLIDEKGTWVVNPQFNSLYRFGAEDQLLAMDQSDQFAVIDAAGKYISASFPEAKIELLQNVSGVGARFMAHSDYVDVEAYAELIDAEIHTLKSTTTGALKSTYKLTDSQFPKEGGNVTLYNRKHAANEMIFRLSAAGVNAWNKASDGWFGYNYTFRPDVPINSYTFTVEFERGGKVGRFVNEILDVLKAKYAYNEENSSLTIPGYASIFVTAIPNGGIILRVKPE